MGLISDFNVTEQINLKTRKSQIELIRQKWIELNNKLFKELYKSFNISGQCLK